MRRLIPRSFLKECLRRRIAVVPIALLLACARATAQSPYFPAAGDRWERRTPEQVGMKAEAVRDAVALAIASEATTPRDLLENHLRSFAREPHGEAIGPFAPAVARRG